MWGSGGEENSELALLVLFPRGLRPPAPLLTSVIAKRLLGPIAAALEWLVSNDKNGGKAVEPAGTLAATPTGDEPASIQELSLDELLEGGITIPPKPATIWVKWLEEEPVYPGLSRFRAADLYSAYLTWCFVKGREFTGEPLTMTAWGRLMGAKFKKQVGRMGAWYLISKSPNPSLPQYIVDQIEAEKNQKR